MPIFPRSSRMCWTLTFVDLGWRVLLDQGKSRGRREFPGGIPPGFFYNFVFSAMFQGNIRLYINIGYFQRFWRAHIYAQSVKSQTKKVAIWELISSFILVRSWFNCQIQFKNIHYAINRGRNEMRKCCIFCLCMRLMRIKIFTCASRCAYPHMRIIRMNRMDPQPHGQA